MNTALWKKAIGESKLLLIVCALGLFLFAFVRVWLVSLVEMSRFAEIIGQLWTDIEKFSLVPLSHLLTYPGRIAVFYNEPMVVLLISVWAIARGSDAVSGEINRGTMEMILSQPVSRLQVLSTQAIVGIVGVCILTFTAWLGTAAGIYTFKAKEAPPIPTLTIPFFDVKVPIFWRDPSDTRDPLDNTDDPKTTGGDESDGPQPIRTPLSEKVSPSAMTPASLNLAALGFFLLAMTTMLSAFDQHRWRTIGIAVTIWVIMSIMKVVGMAVEDVAWLQYLSFFTPYSPEWAVYVGARNPGDLWLLDMLPGPGDRWFCSPLTNNLILIGLGTLCYGIAGTAFCNRDLPAPL